MGIPIRDLLQQSAHQLRLISDSPRLDAEILLAHCLQKARSYLYTWPERVPEPPQLVAYSKLLQQRLTGQPIAYLIGYREFWGMPLNVTPDTLIPRPETELLIETVLQHTTKHDRLNILDLGTGSGAIAIALGSELPQATITATDRSAAALAVARANAHQHQQHRIRFLLSDWFSMIPTGEHFDIIVSNPPYIALDDIHLTQGDVRFEPPSALISGTDGLNDIRHIIKCARVFLHENGLLLLEHGYNQAAAIRQIMQQNHYRDILCIADLAGNDRLSGGHYRTPLRDQP